jgi:OOP family OmpA-OmpF porin
MKKGFILITVFCALLLAGFSASNAFAIEILTEEDLIKNVVEKEYFVKTADNFIVLFDSSSSMLEPYSKDKSMTRYDIAKKILKDRSDEIPDLGFNAGMYLYTPWKEVYPMGPYDPMKFAQSVDSLPAQAMKTPTLLQQGLSKLEDILKGLSGRTSVFLFNDGSFSDVGPIDPRDKAAQLAKDYNACFYLISKTKSEKEQKFVRDMVKLSPCSRVITFEDYIERPEYNYGALFIVKSTVQVTTLTEERLAGVVIENVLFDFNSVEVKPEFHAELNELGDFLTKNPTAYALLAGFGDNVGSMEANNYVSYRRAEAVAEYIMSNFNIPRERLIVSWYGYLNPIANNNLPEGRALNRRVEIAIGGI